MMDNYTKFVSRLRSMNLKQLRDYKNKQHKIIEEENKKPKLKKDYDRKMLAEAKKNDVEMEISRKENLIYLDKEIKEDKNLKKKLK